MYTITKGHGILYSLKMLHLWQVSQVYVVGCLGITVIISF